MGWLRLIVLGIGITLGGGAFLNFLPKDAANLRPVGWALLGIGNVTIVIGAILGPARGKRVESKTKTDEAGFKFILIGIGANVLGGAMLSLLDKDTEDLRPLAWALLVIGMSAIVFGVVIFPGGGKRLPDNRGKDEVEPPPRREGKVAPRRHYR